jgi:transcriptional regulator GlxA family with amidase domain
MRRVLIVAYEDAELLDIACPADVFDAATRWGADPPYSVELASLGGRPVRTAAGLVLAARPLERIAGRLDTVVVSGGLGSLAAATDGRLLEQVRRVSAAARRTASVCTGAELLAAAGLLDGRRATTHWMWATALAERHPKVRVDPAPLYVRDGDFYTSAGVTSALDLSLALVADDHGPELARHVARSLVTYLQRPGNQAQVSLFMAAPAPADDVVRRVCDHITAHLADDLSAEALAAVAGVGPRQLARLFDLHLHTTPARHVRAVRTEAAGQLLAATRLPLGPIARRCGFRSTETLRQAFQDLYATSPSAYRASVTCGPPPS